VGTLPGAAAKPRSTSLGFSCVTQMPALSPCRIEVTGLWNMWMLLMGRESLRAGSSIEAPTLQLPCRDEWVVTGGNRATRCVDE